MVRRIDPEDLPPSDGDQDGDDAGFVNRPTQGRKKAEKYPTKRPAIEKARALPFPEWAEKYLKLRNTDGELVPFVLNPVQKKIDDEWERQLKERGYVKIRILKARKMGASTYVQGKIFRAILERQGWHAGVMAHDDTGCDFVFDRAKVFNDFLPAEMKRTLVKNNKKEIAYENPHGSFLRVNVAKAKGAWGSGGDIHMLHFSERAKWPSVRGASKAQGQAAAVLNAMPKNVVGCAVVDESTALGRNEFCDAWKDAQPDSTLGTRWGRDGFVALFFPWFEFHEYRLPGKKPADFYSDPEWEKDEPMLRKVFGCDDEQLAWRRWTIAESCEADLDTYRQEMPSTAEEAFQASGRPVFAASLIHDRYTIIERREKANPTRRWSFNAKGEIEEDRRGELRFFRQRGTGELTNDLERYVITADPAGAGAHAPDQMKGDPACAYVWDRALDEQIAEWHGWCDPAEFAHALVWLGGLYGNPLLIPEGGAWGGHVISVLQRLDYPRIYFHEKVGDDLQTIPTHFGKYGWATTPKTKPRMVDALRHMWNERRIAVNSLECCAEHLTFVKNGTRREAQSGCHDDRVMACAIYALWSAQHPYEVPSDVYVPRPLTCGMVIEEMLEADKSRRRGFRL